MERGEREKEKKIYKLNIFCNMHFKIIKLNKLIDSLKHIYYNCNILIKY